MPDVPQRSNYGDSFSLPRGPLISQYDTLGELLTSGLNQTNLIDNVTFSNFEQGARSYILGSLGFPTIRVELTDYQIKLSIDDAVSKLYYHLPQATTQFMVFNASANQNLYELPPHVVNNITYVGYQKNLLTFIQQSTSLEFDVFLRYFTDTFVFSDFSVGEYLLTMQHLEMIKKVLSNDGSWQIINNKWIQLSPTPVITPSPVIIEYRALDSNTIHPYFRNWLYRFALARAMGRLGLVRRKYKVLPSPGGGATLDGEALVKEAKEEEQLLIDELMNNITEIAPFTVY